MIPCQSILVLFGANCRKERYVIKKKNVILHIILHIFLEKVL